MADPGSTATDDHTQPTREQLLRRVSELRAGAGGPGEPLSWEDIGLLVHGLAFAERPLQKAGAEVIARHGLMPRGAWILSLISGGITYPHELADIFQIGRSLISAELARLSEAGLITSRRGVDRRRTELALTELGEGAVKEVRGRLDAIVRSALAAYSPEQVRLCAGMLRELREAAGAT